MAEPQREMTMDEAAAMIMVLAKRSGLPLPRLFFRTFGATRSCANYHSHSIRFKPARRADGTMVICGKWSPASDVVLHEWTHLVAWRKRGCRTHGKPFMQELAVLAAAWYGDATRYQWEKEYKSILSMAQTAGLSPKQEVVEIRGRTADAILKMNPEAKRFLNPELRFLYDLRYEVMP